METNRRNLLYVAFLALAMCTLIPQKAHAQERIPFLAEGKTWTFIDFYQNMGDKLVPKDTVEYSVLGDTLVKGRTCKAIETEIGTVPAYQEGRNIWFYAPGDEEPRIMYEFDCKVGDSIHIDSQRQCNAVVTQVDSVNIDGVYYREVRYSMDGTEDEECVYNELIGCGRSVLNQVPVVGTCFSLSVTLNGESLLAKLPVHSVEQSEKPATDNRIYNLQGVRLQQPPKYGVYIQNGKKFVVK